MDKIVHRDFLKSKNFKVPIYQFPNVEIFQHVFRRQQNVFNRVPLNHLNEYLSRRIPNVLVKTERKLPVGQINKIFASHWLSHNEVVIGTKCNKIICLNIATGRTVHIESLKSSTASKPAVFPCGVHAISINPSQTLLATGGENTNDLAVYEIPSFDRYSVGECGHKDWIFDLRWIDDEYLVSGSRDSTIALWKFHNDRSSINTSSTNESESDSDLPVCSFVRPVKKAHAEKSERVRSIAYCSKFMETAALSANAFLHIWDMGSLKQKLYARLEKKNENVCIVYSDSRAVYAIGSQSHVTIISADSGVTQKIIGPLDGGIRSLSFNNDVIVIGTGSGTVCFYDLKADKFLDDGFGHQCRLVTDLGYLRHDDNYHNYFFDRPSVPNAIYTHCFDSSGVRLFTAGGPLHSGLWGNYAGIWS